MKTVITYGTFDILHIGHINLLRKARSLGEKLIVGVSTDEFNKIKNKRSVLNYENRKSVVEALSFVDQVIPEENWEQKIDDVISFAVDIFVIGDDWRGKFDFLNSHCEVIYFPRTPEISSTMIRSALYSDISSAKERLYISEIPTITINAK